MKVAFCDRDGTLMRDYADNQWAKINDPEFYDDTFTFLHAVKRKGYEVIIISNQYLIGEGYITQGHYDMIAEKFLLACQEHGVEPLAVYYCPHAHSEHCRCMKPNPGMIEQACHDFPEINLKQSFVVGNTLADVVLARNLEIQSFGLGAGEGCSSNVLVPNLSSILKYI